MIFSLTGEPSLELELDLPGTDVFCFFHTKDSVLLETPEWKRGIVASLKLKKSVLLLEKNIPKIQFDPSRRWVVGEEFLWLAPRSLSVLLEAFNEPSMTYESLKSYLTSFK